MVWMIGIDTGGTFTDVSGVDRNGRVIIPGQSVSVDDQGNLIARFVEQSG